MTSTDVTGPKAHPAFAAAFPTGDVTLLSRDDVLFPISSSTLSRASPWFRNMLALPQGARRTSDAEPYIAMSESSDVLMDLLSMISGISLPTLNNVNTIQPLLYAAEKYEMTMPIAIIRIALQTLVAKHPIRAYGIARHMSWDEEAEAAVRHTLELDIMSEDNARELAHLEGPDLTKLLMLHDRRRKMVAAALADTAQFNVGNMSDRRCCGDFEDRTTWWNLKMAWVTEPWRFLCLSQLVPGIAALPVEVELAFESKCPKCKRHFYARRDTLEAFKRVARSLPQTIKVRTPVANAKSRSIC